MTAGGVGVGVGGAKRCSGAGRLADRLGATRTGAAACGCGGLTAVCTTGFAALACGLADFAAGLAAFFGAAGRFAAARFGAAGLRAAGLRATVFAGFAARLGAVGRFLAGRTTRFFLAAAFFGAGFLAAAFFDAGFLAVARWVPAFFAGLAGLRTCFAFFFTALFATRSSPGKERRRPARARRRSR
ncbi:MAG: hypothetical protein NDJ75_02960 [Thermoanaerobaculia bacterium]|nr:hypothetical protein [Thermoanaerobaculia bacterium]